MPRFGGWHGYRSAPQRIVEEQICVWLGKNKADAEANTTPEKP